MTFSTNQTTYFQIFVRFLMAILGLFLFSSFQYIYIVSNIADDWIRTTDLWCWKRPHYQLRHNYGSPFFFLEIIIFTFSTFQICIPMKMRKNICPSRIARIEKI